MNTLCLPNKGCIASVTSGLLNMSNYNLSIAHITMTCTPSLLVITDKPACVTPEPSFMCKKLLYIIYNVLKKVHNMYVYLRPDLLIPT